MFQDTHIYYHVSIGYYIKNSLYPSYYLQNVVVYNHIVLYSCTVLQESCLNYF